MPDFGQAYGVEKRNSRVALVLAIVVHGVLLAVLVSIVAWRAPDPPLPQTGIELSLGIEDVGGGDEEPASEPSQEPDPQTQPEQDLPEAEEETSDVVTQPESPVAVPEKPVEQPKPQPEKKVEKPTVKPVEKPVEKPIQKSPDPKPAEQAKAVYKAPESSDNNSTGKGEKANEPGKQGSPEGKVDAKALYGPPGGGGSGTGAGLQGLSGWRWDREPKPKVPENEKGRIVFEIEVDDEGQITKLITVERGVSPAADKTCRDEILRLNFIQIGNKAPESSKGRVTIVVNAQ